MPTQRQKKVAEFLIKNATLDNPLNGGEIMAKVGYTSSQLSYPGKVIQSEGVQEALEIAGFNVPTAKQVVAEIMLSDKTDPGTKLRATDQVFKVMGTYAPEKNLNINITPQTPEQEQKAEAFEKWYKNQMSKS